MTILALRNVKIENGIEWHTLHISFNKVQVQLNLQHLVEYAET